MAITRYAAVGAFATACHYGTLLIAVERWGVHPGGASFVGAVLGACVAYAGNRHLTFHASTAPQREAVPRFAATAVGAAVLHGAIVNTSDALGVPYLGMQGVATVTMMFLTYEINRRWTFAGQTTQWGARNLDHAPRPAAASPIWGDGPDIGDGEGDL